MRRTRTRFAFALVSVGVLAAIAAPQVSSSAAPRPAAGGVSAVPTSKLVDGKLTPRLAALASPVMRSRSWRARNVALSLPAAGAGSLLRQGDRVLVDVGFVSHAASHVGALRRAGARIEFVSSRYQTVTVAVRPTALHAVAAVRGVRGVQEILTPVVNGSSAAGRGKVLSCHGSKNSEGDAQLKASNARSSFSVDGTGVKVGVLSDSYDQNAGAATHASDDVTSGDLPGPGGACGLTAVHVLDDTAASGEDEGRGMLQIVHDLAPGAALAFATAFNGETSFANNIRALKTDGAKVIVDDVTYFDEPFFQDGPVSVAVNDVTAGGAAYYSSAANNNLIKNGHNVSSFEAPAFRNAGTCPAALSPATQCMDFNPGTAKDPTYGVSVANGSTAKVDLQWAQPWFGVTTDLDLYLVTTGGTILASSESANVSNTQKPFEFVSWHNTTGSTQVVNLAITRFTGSGGGNTGTPRLKLIFLENGDTGVFPTEYQTSSGGDTVGPAIFGHNGAGNAMSVAAVPYNNSATVETYSSRGPVTLRFGPVNGTTPASAITPHTLAKPDIAATDCGVTTFFASFDGTNWRFCGTSAAAPHAGAVAALEYQVKPAATFQQVRDSQTSTAVAVGSFTHTAAGAGLLDAQAAATSLNAAPNQFTLTVSRAGAGASGGTVVDDNAGHLSCPPTCSFAYDDGTIVHLTATANGTATFASFAGCDSTSTNHCTVTVDANKTVTATFNSNDHTNPTAHMTKPTASVTVSKSVPLAWVASDTGGSGFKNVDIRVQSAKFNAGFGAFTQPAGLQHLTGTTKTFTGVAGTSYCFEVRARDNAGNLSAFSAKKCTMIPVDDKTMAASGSWTRKSGQAGAWLGTLSVATAHGASLKLLNVHTRQVGIMVKTCPGCGEVQILFGSQSLGFADLNRTTGFTIFVGPVFSSVRTGSVTFKVSSSGKKVQIDGLAAPQTGKITLSAVSRSAPGVRPLA
jgi:hypothetical protein